MVGHLVAVLFAAVLLAYVQCEEHAETTTVAVNGTTTLDPAAELAEMCANITISEKEVLDLILANYSKEGRPRKNASDAIEVTIGISLFGVRDFNEIDSTLVLGGYINLLWSNDFIKWSDKFPHNCFSYIYFDADLVWCPAVTFMSGHMSKDPSMYPSKGVKVATSSDGGMELYPMGELSIMCQLDLSMFPFDIQICTVIIESSTYPNSVQSFLLYAPANTTSIQMTDNIWVQNEEWELMDNFSAIVQPFYTPNSTVQYDRAIFILRLRRRPVFYRVHVIIPGVIIGVVQIVTFILPIDEVLKLPISFTCLLAYSVFEDMVVKEIPKSQHVPLLSIYINLQMSFIGAIAILGEAVVLVLIRQALFKKPPPDWLFQIFKTAGFIVFHECQMLESQKNVEPPPPVIRSIYTTYGEEEAHQHFVLMEYGVSLRSMGNLVKKDRSSNSTKRRRRLLGEDEDVYEDEVHYTETFNTRQKWIFMAEVIERCNMWIYMVCTIMSPLFLFFYYSDERKIETHYAPAKANLG